MLAVSEGKDQHYKQLVSVKIIKVMNWQLQLGILEWGVVTQACYRAKYFEHHAHLIGWSHTHTHVRATIALFNFTAGCSEDTRGEKLMIAKLFFCMCLATEANPVFSNLLFVLYTGFCVQIEILARPVEITAAAAFVGLQHANFVLPCVALPLEQTARSHQRNRWID